MLTAAACGVSTTFGSLFRIEFWSNGSILNASKPAPATFPFFRAFASACSSSTLPRLVLINPHFHVLCPIRPIEQDGKWGLKQRRVYELDEDGNRIRDQNGEYVFNAVPTTDWGSPETLEHWRQTWAELCNAKFAEKGLDVRIDHRSYERQGVDLLPTIHEGATVRAMEKKGIRTEKGEFNRWIKATNAVIRDIKKKITSLMGWIADMKAELAKPQLLHHQGNCRGWRLYLPLWQCQRP